MNPLFYRLYRPAAGLLLVALFAAGCGGSNASTPATEEAEETLRLGTQDVAIVRRDSFRTGVFVTGTLRPYKVVNLEAQVSGTIGDIRVDAGDAVSRGQRLAGIEAAGIRSQVAQAKAAVAAAEAQQALARRQMESAKALYEAGAMSSISYENAQAAFEAAQAQVAAAEAQLANAKEQASRTFITAPLTGQVSERSVEVGEPVSVGTPLFTLVNTDYLELAGHVPVEQAARVEVGQPVLFTIDAYPNRTFRGTVDRVEPTADPASRQVGVYLRLPNQTYDLVGGLYASGRILQKNLTDALVIPDAALRQSGETPFVYVIRDGRLERQPVQVKGRNQRHGLVAVAGELSAGEYVLTASGTSIPAGARVHIGADTTNAAADTTGK